LFHINLAADRSGFGLSHVSERQLLGMGKVLFQEFFRFAYRRETDIEGYDHRASDKRRHKEGVSSAHRHKPPFSKVTPLGSVVTGYKISAEKKYCKRPIFTD
jgi:hypothetical protein